MATKTLSGTDIQRAEGSFFGAIRNAFARGWHRYLDAQTERALMYMASRDLAGLGLARTDARRVARQEVAEAQAKRARKV